MVRHSAAFEDEMTAAKADWQMLIHGGALHGFMEHALDGRPVRAAHILLDEAMGEERAALVEFLDAQGAPRGRLRERRRQRDRQGRRARPPRST
jgi:hypothetical protein